MPKKVIGLSDIMLNKLLVYRFIDGPAFWLGRLLVVRLDGGFDVRLAVWLVCWLSSQIAYLLACRFTGWLINCQAS